MGLITRQGKGSKLTIQEMDDNLLYLQSLSGSTISGGTSGTSGIDGTDGTSGTSGIDGALSSGTTITQLLFNTGVTLTNLSAGTLYYDTNENALSYKPNTPQNDVTINLGQESVIRIYNDTGSQINNGQVCHISGSHDHVTHYDSTVVLADASFMISGTGSTSVISGVATHDIPDGTDGFITKLGLVRDINTNGIPAGQAIYLSDTTPGAFTSFSGLSSKCSRANKVGRVLVTGVTDGIILIDISNENEISVISQRRTNDLTINNASSGIISFAGFSINADTTKFDIGEIHGWLADNTTDPDNPTITYINFTGQTAVTPTYLATDPVTYVGIDKDLNIIQSDTPFTNTQTRDYIDLGVIVHSNNVNVNVVNNQPVVMIDIGNQLYDLIRGLGFFNISGNVYSSADSNLQISKTAGYIFKQGSNFENDIKDPHKKYMDAVTGLTFNYRLQDSTEYSGKTQIDPNNYDNGGVLTTVSNNKFTIQRIAIFSSNSTRIQYGQNMYDSMADAVSAVATESFVVEPNIEGNGLLRYYLCIKQGTTDLSDTTKARFIEAGRFGTVAGTGGISVTTLQKAYDNSTNPEIITNSTLDGVTFRRGSSADTDHVLQIQNGAGNTTSYITGAGKNVVKTLSITGMTEVSGYTRYLVSDSQGNINYQAGSSSSGGTSGTSGTSGTDGTSGSSGTSGIDGSGTSGTDGTSGTSGIDGVMLASGIVTDSAQTYITLDNIKARVQNNGIGFYALPQVALVSGTSTVGWSGYKSDSTTFAQVFQSGFTIGTGFTYVESEGLGSLFGRSDSLVILFSDFDNNKVYRISYALFRWNSPEVKNNAIIIERLL